MSEPTPGSPAPRRRRSAAADLSANVASPSKSSRTAEEGTDSARAAEAERLSQLRDDSISEASWKAYLIAWDRWADWAITHGRPVLPASPHDLGAWAHSAAFPDPTTATPATDSTPRTEGRPGRRAGRARATGPISASTLSKWMAAITYVHTRAGHSSPVADPELAQTLKGLRRRMAAAGATQRRQAPALMTEDVERILTAMEGSPTRGRSLVEVRDRALILLAFTSAMRASELAALNVEDLEPDAGGLIVRIRTSKTDQEGAGAFVAIPWARRPHLCPVRAVDTWLHRLSQQLAVQDPTVHTTTQPDPEPVNSRTGARTRRSLAARRALVADLDGAVLRAIFRNGSIGSTRVPNPHQARMAPLAISKTITARARAAGLQAPEVHGSYFTAHSTRAGFATQAADNGVSERDIMNHGRWKSVQVARGYIRRVESFGEGNAAGHLGL